MAQQIYDAGVIKNKYVLMAKIKISQAGGDIKAGTYSLSQAMTYNEIIKIITGGVSLDMDQKKTEDKKVDSSMGAGGGGSEGETGPAEDGGTGSDNASGDNSSSESNDSSDSQ